MNKASGGDRIPAELFQILKDDSVKALYSICQQHWKNQQWPQDWEKSVFIPIPKRDMPKNVQTTTFISHASKVMLKILQARLQQYVNRELPGVQAGFRKGRGTREQIANICWIIEKAREYRKTSTSVSSVMPKPLTVWIIINCRKLLTRWEYQTILPVSWDTCVWVKKQELEPCVEQLIGSRLRKKYDRAFCCHPVYLIYVRNTSWEMLGWMSYKLESK